jgi:hypothetical protein
VVRLIILAGSSEEHTGLDRRTSKRLDTGQQVAGVGVHQIRTSSQQTQVLIIIVDLVAELVENLLSAAVETALEDVDQETRGKLKYLQHTVDSIVPFERTFNFGVALCSTSLGGAGGLLLRSLGHGRIGVERVVLGRIHRGDTVTRVGVDLNGRLAGSKILTETPEGETRLLLGFLGGGHGGSKESTSSRVIIHSFLGRSFDRSGKHITSHGGTRGRGM